MGATDVFPFMADYDVEEDILEGVIRQAADSGRLSQRVKAATRRLWRLQFLRRASSEREQAITDFYEKFKNDYFLFRHDVYAGGSWNLLGPDAEAERSGAGTAIYNYKFDGTDEYFPIAALGLEAGDKLRIAADLKTSVAGGESVSFRMQFFDAAKSSVGISSSAINSGDTYIRAGVTGITIPANTVYFQAQVIKSGAVETGFAKNAKICHDATDSTFAPPFTNTEYVPRFFPVQFAGPPRHVLVGNEAYDLDLTLIEAVGKALPAVGYPDPNDGIKTIFQEESAGYVVAGAWTQASDSNAHGGAEKTNPNTNTTDRFRFIYSGYGFRLWARKASNLGIVQVLLDGVSLGNVDLYAAAPAAAAALLTKLDAPLGLHVVELKATNTRNGSSSANTIIADAIEIMP